MKVTMVSSEKGVTIYSGKAKKPKKKVKKHTKAECLTLFQKWAKLRECTDGYGYCISCGKRYPSSQLQGGHYVSRACLCLSDDEDNVHAQCPACNVLMKGNLIGYRRGLERKIGASRLMRLDDMYFASRGDDEAFERLSPSDKVKVKEKRSAQYWDERYKEIKQRLKELEDES